ncbi:hypothetical protein WH5701_09585 [Synechococcus sp. WH 5701]|nr:hypothetical protein WH5701_09585 [Synechococcus sp. WH 5701]
MAGMICMAGRLQPWSSLILAGWRPLLAACQVWLLLERSCIGALKAVCEFPLALPQPAFI